MSLPVFRSFCEKCLKVTVHIIRMYDKKPYVVVYNECITCGKKTKR